MIRSSGPPPGLWSLAALLAPCSGVQDRPAPETPVEAPAPLETPVTRREPEPERVTPVPSLAILVGIVKMEDLFPSPPSDSLGPDTTARLMLPDPPPDGVRERMGGLEIRANQGDRWTVDSVVDTRTGAILLDGKPTADERESVREEGSWLQRGVRVLVAGDRWVSVAVGTSWFSAGAAHANNDLRCAALDRAHPGRTAKVSDVAGARALRRARRAVRPNPDALEPSGGPYTVDPRSFLVREDGSVGFCAEPGFSWSGQVEIVP